MNFTLFGYILSWICLAYSVFTLLITYIAYTQLTPFQKRCASITLGKEYSILAISVVFIVTYHIS